MPVSAIAERGCGRGRADRVELRGVERIRRRRPRRPRVASASGRSGRDERRARRLAPRHASADRVRQHHRPRPRARRCRSLGGARRSARPSPLDRAPRIRAARRHRRALRPAARRRARSRMRRRISSRAALTGAPTTRETSDAAPRAGLAFSVQAPSPGSRAIRPSCANGRPASRADLLCAAVAPIVPANVHASARIAARSDCGRGAALHHARA